MTEKIRATFQPEGRKAEVSPGEKILKAAQRIGIDISSICGGKGNCGKCKIIVRRGWQHLDPPTTAERRFLSKDEIVEHYRLACSLTVRESVVIEVPARSRTGSQRLQTEGIEVPVKAKPLVRKHLVQVKPPTL
ncbi:MAG: 2Fe-2S iron-sulfur cluster binding domain-containing protein, partial [Nitrososphaeria archaeon]|nr:2Fe-2S iron-sulfur cluster binding domain-containing protein [Nitrososphaeria archaeon]